MVRNFCITATLLLLMVLMASTGLADIVPISLSQSVSAGGGPIVCNVVGGGPPQFDCRTGSIELGASNTQPGPYTVDETGTATVSLPDNESNETKVLGETIDLQQISDETSDSISVELSSEDQVFSPEPYGFFQSGVNSGLTNEYSLEFDLTAATVMHITGSISSFAMANLEDTPNVANVGFLLTGPGFQLASPDNYYLPDLEYTAVLDPGVYTLKAFADIQDNTYFFSGPDESVGELSFNLISAVPEPRWAVLPALLLAIGIGGAALRRRKPAGS